jgi:RHS repeat-associated protein
VKNSKRLGILFLFLAVASSLFATVSEKPRQGLVSIFEDLQPASEARESVSDAGVQPSGTVTPRHTNQFTGRRWDGFSQTYNHRNRYYQPKTGRFTSRDKLGFDADINLYRYANGNPLRWLDPFGLGVDDAYTLLYSNFLYRKAAQELQDLINNKDWEGILDFIPNTLKPNLCINAHDKGKVIDEIMKEPDVMKSFIIRLVDQAFTQHKFTPPERQRAINDITRWLVKFKNPADPNWINDPKVLDTIRRIIADILNNRDKG